MNRYQKTPTSPAQSGCPHALRNKDNTECSTCGSIKVKGRWHYLTASWFTYYVNGGTPPEKYVPKGVAQ